jgi:hypothetical protein
MILPRYGSTRGDTRHIKTLVTLRHQAHVIKYIANNWGVEYIRPLHGHVTTQKFSTAFLSEKDASNQNLMGSYSLLNGELSKRPCGGSFLFHTDRYLNSVQSHKKVFLLVSDVGAVDKDGSELRHEIYSNGDIRVYDAQGDLKEILVFCKN